MKGRRRLERKLFPLKKIIRLINFHCSGSQEGDEEENEAKAQGPGGQVGDDSSIYTDPDFFLIDFFCLRLPAYITLQCTHTYIFLSDPSPIIGYACQ